MKQDALSQMDSEARTKPLLLSMVGGLLGALLAFLYSLLQGDPFSLWSLIIGAVIGLAGGLTWGIFKRPSKPDNPHIRVTDQAIEEVNGTDVNWSFSWDDVEQVGIRRSDAGDIDLIRICSDRSTWNTFGKVAVFVELFPLSYFIPTSSFVPRTLAGTDIYDYESMNLLYEMILPRVGSETIIEID